jgi:hypothetical protein
MSYDSLIESTISNKSKKSVSCANKISYPSILSHDTKTSKVSERDNPHDFILRTSIMHFYPNLTLKDTGTMLRRNLKKNQNYIGQEFHQKPDHPSTFMKIVKERTRTMSPENDERRQVLPSKVFWDGTINRFEVFRNNVEGHYGQIGAGY